MSSTRDAMLMTVRRYRLAYARQGAGFLYETPTDDDRVVTGAGRPRPEPRPRDERIKARPPL